MTESQLSGQFLVSSLLICLWLAGFGTQIDYRPLLRHIKQPKGLLIGLGMQVIFLPAWTTLLLFIFNVKGALGMAFLIVGSSPGGSFSNVWCLLANSDLALSAAMTGLSTFVCSGSMVANLALWGSLISDDSNDIPYLQIIVPALLIVLGTGTGMYLRVKCDLQDNHLLILKRVTAIFGILLVSIGVWLIYREQTPRLDLGSGVWFIAILMNGTALVFGAAAGYWFGLKKPEAVSVGFEVSTQNLSIPLFIFANGYDGQARTDMTTILFLFGIWSLIQNIFYLFIVRKIGWTYDTIPMDDEPGEGGQTPVLPTSNLETGTEFGAVSRGS